MKLTKKEIKFLATSFQPQTPMSIFANINDLPDGSEYQSLVDKGIIEGNAYNASALNLLMLLTKPERCSRLIIQNSFYLIEKYTYRVGDTLVLAENNEGVLDFEILSDPSEIGIKLSEFFGMSRIATADIDEIFTTGELLVLLAMIDITRQKSLIAYADTAEKVDIFPISFTSQSINTALTSGYKNGLVEIFLKNYKQVLPQAGQLDMILQSLVQKGVVIMNGGYQLSKAYEHFGRNFLIPESITMYEAMSMLEGGEVAAIARVCVTAGINDILTMLFDGEQVLVKTVSSAQLITNIEEFMSCPEIKNQEADKVVPPAQPTIAVPTPTAPMTPPPVNVAAHTSHSTPSNNNWTCHCGRENTGNFCAGCGSKRP